MTGPSWGKMALNFGTSRDQALISWRIRVRRIRAGLRQFRLFQAPDQPVHPFRDVVLLAEVQPPGQGLHDDQQSLGLDPFLPGLGTFVGGVRSCSAMLRSKSAIPIPRHVGRCATPEDNDVIARRDSRGHARIVHRRRTRVWSRSAAARNRASESAGLLGVRIGPARLASASSGPVRSKLGERGPGLSGGHWRCFS